MTEIPETTSRRGRPSRYAKYDALYEECEIGMSRPRFVDNIGVRRGKRGDTVWVKLVLENPNTYNGRHYKAGQSVEIGIGKKATVSWEEAIKQRDLYEYRDKNSLPLEGSTIPTVGDWADDWLERKKAMIKRPDTEESHIKRFIKPTFGTTRIDQVTPAQIEHWLAELQNEHDLAPSSRSRILDTLKSVMNDALRERHIIDNPCDRVGKIKGIKPRTRFLEPVELFRLLQVAEGMEEWVYNMIAWAVHSGMRRGEIQNMRWSDVHEQDGGGKIVRVISGKTDKLRIVPCTLAMLNVLESQEQYRDDESDDDRIFPVSKMTWRRRWETCREKSGIKDLRFHDLRRTSATLSAAGGVDIRTLADRLGHCNLAMLEKHYAMVMGSAQTEAAMRVQATFDGWNEKVVNIDTAKQKAQGA